MCLSLSPKAGKKPSSPFESHQAEEFPSYLGKCQTFHSIQVFNWLNGAHPHYGQQSALLSLPILMLVLPKNTQKDIPWIMFDQIFGHLMARSNFTQKGNHHTMENSARKRKELFIHNSLGEAPGNYAEWNETRSQNITYCMIPFIRHSWSDKTLQMWNRWGVAEG